MCVCVCVVITPGMQSCTVYSHGSGQPYGIAGTMYTCKICVYGMSSRGICAYRNYQACGHVRCIYTVLSNPIYRTFEMQGYAC